MQPLQSQTTSQSLDQHTGFNPVNVTEGLAPLITAQSWSSFDPNAEGAMPGHDIFEELAMLDSIEPSGQNPQFMQNLGFGPDLDLAEFFGSDYQPSNPLLTYMQPQSGHTPGGELG